MKKLLLSVATMLFSSVVFAQYHLVNMTDDVFAKGGDSEWSFEKYNYSTGNYSKFNTYGDSCMCNFLDIYQPERTGGILITGIDGVEPNGDNTWGNPVRKGWFDVPFTLPIKTNGDEKFCYVSRLSELGNAFEVYGNQSYSTAISFTVPKDGYYKVNGIIQRQDNKDMKTIYVVPRYRYTTDENQNHVDTLFNMGLAFPFGEGGDYVEGATNWNLVSGANQRYTAQEPNSLSFAFQGKAGDIISFEVNVFSYGVPTDGNTWARSYFSRCFYRQLDIDLCTQTEAEANENFVNPYDSSNALKVINHAYELDDSLGNLAAQDSIGNNYNQYPEEARDTFDAFVMTIMEAYENGKINTMNANSYMKMIDHAWAEFLASKIILDIHAEGNYVLLDPDRNIGEVVPGITKDNNDSPWGFYCYDYSSTKFTKFTTWGTTKDDNSSGWSKTGWCNSSSEWLFITEAGKIHTTTTDSPVFMFTAAVDGVYRFGVSCYRINPNTSKENPMYIRTRYVTQEGSGDDAVLTCPTYSELKDVQYGSVKNDGMSGKAPVDLDFFAVLKKGDKIATEFESHTSQSNSNAGTMVTRLFAAPNVAADSIITLKDAIATGLYVFNPYGTGNATELNATIEKADSMLTIVTERGIGSEEGQYGLEEYDALVSVLQHGKELSELEGDPSVSQVEMDNATLAIKEAITAVSDSRIPYQVILEGNYSIRVAGTDKYWITKQQCEGSTDGHHYMAFLNNDGVVADAKKNSIQLDQYSQIFRFLPNFESGGMNIFHETHGTVISAGYVIDAESADSTYRAQNRFKIVKENLTDSLVSILRMSDGKYFTTTYNWNGTYNTIVTQNTKNPVFVIEEPHAIVDPTASIISHENKVEGIDSIVAIYNISGIRINQLQKGINIVRYGNGKVKNVLVK